jgi:hypothetical protein
MQALLSSHGAGFITVNLQTIIHLYAQFMYASLPTVLSPNSLRMSCVAHYAVTFYISKCNDINMPDGIFR